MDFTAGLMPLDTALTQMLNRITPLSAVETVPLLQAFSRVTAHDLISPLDVPGFDNSAMDGYAVRLADLADGAALPVAGKAFAGQPFHDAWPAGSCIRIMTGAPVPPGCDAVVMQEETEQTEEGIRFHENTIRSFHQTDDYVARLLTEEENTELLRLLNKLRDALQ